MRRHLDDVLDEVLLHHPAVLLVGPRATGKTTTAQRRSSSMIRLNRSSEAFAVRSDPYAVIAASPRPVLIDEWQLVPEVLSAVKEEVDAGAPPGSFILTGSARADLTAQGWPMTGRVIRIPMWGLTPRELEVGDLSNTLLSRLSADADIERLPDDLPDLRGYLHAVFRSGFPVAALSANDAARRRFLSSYVEEVVNRDLALVGGRHSGVKIRNYLRAIAANTAGIVQHKTLFDAAEIERSTAVGYDDLLEQLMITERLPAWSTNRFHRLTQLPKRHVVDPALLQPLLGVDARSALRDGDALGRLIESFVVAQLRVEVAIDDRSPAMFHLRDANGRREIDVLIEYPNGDLVAIEVKATATPDRDDARHIRWLRDGLPDRQVVGVVFHTGRRAFRFEPGIQFLPIAALWA